MQKVKVQKVSVKDVIEDYKAKGKGNKIVSFSQIEDSGLPEVGMFKGHYFHEYPENPGANHYRLKAVDEKGKEFSVSLSRLLRLSVDKPTKESTLSENNIVLRPTKNGLKYFISGKNLNPEIGNSEPEIIANLVGKQFKAVRRTSFNLPYMREGNYESKKQCLEAIGTLDYYRLSEISEPDGKKFAIETE